MNLTLKIWRQKNANDKGKIVDYPMSDVSPDMSFLEMLDVLNQELIDKNDEPIAFDHDCREGICGTCSMFVNGQAHGPDSMVTVCQLHMRSFKEGDTIVDADQRPLVVERVQDNGDLLLYIGKDGALSEADLGDVSMKHGVDDRLFNGDVETPDVFALRRQTLAYDHKRRISPINGFVGGRIDLIPHQLYIHMK